MCDLCAPPFPYHPSSINLDLCNVRYMCCVFITTWSTHRLHSPPSRLISSFPDDHRARCINHLRSLLVHMLHAQPHSSHSQTLWQTHATANTLAQACVASAFHPCCLLLTRRRWSTCTWRLWCVVFLLFFCICTEARLCTCLSALHAGRAREQLASGV